MEDTVPHPPAMTPKFRLAATFLAACLWLATAPAEARQRPIDSVARATRSRIHWHAVSRAAGPWRPRWWPRELAPGRAGIVIKLKGQRLFVQDAHGIADAFRVSTGARHPTPCGVFRVVEKIRKPSWTYKGQHVEGGIPGNPLGVCWLGLGMPRWWKGAPIGMHGTNAPWVIGHPASHGCIRLRNRDALALYRKVKVGCPVYIVP